MSVAKSGEQKAFENHPNRSLIVANPSGQGKPIKPRGLGPIAAKFWDTTIAELIDQGVATSLDQSSLEALAYWWEVFKVSQESMLTLDFASTSGARAMNANSKAFDNYRRLAQQFGLTPQARNSVTAGSGGEDELESEFD